MGSRYSEKHLGERLAKMVKRRKMADTCPKLTNFVLKVRHFTHLTLFRPTFRGLIEQHWI
jgi:hypothetical protein